MSTGAPRPLLSACMIVRDEEKCLRNCLESIKPVIDELIVVDTGSADSSPDIAREFGASVFSHPWQQDFSLHRNQSICYASGEWILQIDADEILAPESAATIRATLRAAREGVRAFSVSVHDFRRSGARNMVFAYPRLFRNRAGIHYEGIVHNEVLIPGPVVPSNLHLHHFGYDLDAQTMARKFDRSIGLLTRMLEANPDDPKAHFYLAMTYNQYEKFDEARTHAERALLLLEQTAQLTGSHLTVFNILVSAYLMLGDSTRAAQTAERFRTNAPDHPDAHYQICRIAYSTQNFAAVIDAGEAYFTSLQQFLDRGYETPYGAVCSLSRQHAVQSWLGVAFAATGNSEAALDRGRRALQDPLTDEILALELVQNMLATGSAASAQHVLSLAMQRWGKNSDFARDLESRLAGLGQLHLMEGTPKASHLNFDV